MPAQIHFGPRRCPWYKGGLWRLAAFIVVVTLWGGTVYAQEEGEEFDDFSMLDLAALLDVEIDTGSGFKQKISDLPAIVEVMTRERIEALGVRDLYELMLRLTGVRQDASNFYPLLINVPEVRGGSVNDRILLIVDDHPQLGELDEVYNGFSIPIESIERVEFLRGPAAVLYGSSSMAGVLRVVTRKPEQTGGGGTVIVDPIGEGGELSVHGAALLGDGEDNPFALRSDVTVRRNEDWGMELVNDTFGLSGRQPNQVDYLSHLSTLRNEHWYLRVQNHLIQGQMMGLQPSLIFDAGTSNLHLHGVEVGRHWQVQDWKLKTRVALDTRRRRFDFGLFPPPGITVFPDRTTEENRTELQFDGYSTEFYGSAQYSNDTMSILTGLQYRLYGLYNVKFLFKSDGLKNSLFPTDDVKAKVHDANLFLQGSYTPIESITFLVGGRANIYKNQPSNAGYLPPADQDPDAIFSPMGRAAVVWRAAEQLSIKMLYGRSFRLPTLLEMYTAIVGINAPNAQLEPETMDTVELAFDARPVESVSLRLNGYYNRDRNTIESVTNPDPAISETSFQNNDDGFWNYGVESSVDWHPTRWLNIFGSLVYGEGYNYARTAAGDRYQIYERDTPRIIGNGGTTFKPLNDDSLLLTPYVYHRGHSDDADPDTLLHVTARYAPLDWLTVSLHVNNLFGNKFYAPYYLGADRPPIVARAVDTRTLRLGLHAEF